MLNTRGRRRRHELQPNAEINLVNLVDLAFVLLIIFIITAPILQGGIDVQLPKASTQALTSDEGVIVSIDREGKIFIADVPVQSLDDFRNTFPSYMQASGKREAYLRGDERVPYGDVLRLFSVMSELDVAEVGLVAEPEERRR